MLRCIVLILIFFSILLAYVLPRTESLSIKDDAAYERQERLMAFLFLTFTQSILRCSSTSWFFNRKSITGPGVTIIVVDTSAQRNENSITNNVTIQVTIVTGLNNHKATMDLTHIQGQATLSWTEARMKPPSTSYTSSNLNKVPGVIVKE